jgi:hypothetical protein
MPRARANELVSEGSADRVDDLTIKLKPRDDMPKTDDESCRMGPNVTECFADGMEWARALRAGWKPLKDFVIVSAEESQLQQVCAW